MRGARLDDGGGVGRGGKKETRGRKVWDLMLISKRDPIGMSHSPSFARSLISRRPLYPLTSVQLTDRESRLIKFGAIS